uniref:Uncharacterized protein n=1 Tax=Romanomermis culicivorax TaxID=13658 RepID=A0A915JFB2_ROMCU
MSLVSSDLSEKIRDVNCLIEQFSKKRVSLKDYQLDGLRFFIKCYDKGHGAILADEMGLGKTCQAISFLVYLANKIQSAKMLVICPLSVINHWQEELKRFGYGLKPLVYYGNQKERENIIKESKKLEWNIILTTYEMPLRDTSFFKYIPWNCCVVDEGHRLKNAQSLLHNVLKELKIDYYLLLTGTPVQNDLEELYSLLSFTDLNKFSAETKPDYIHKFKKWKISDQNQLRTFLSDYMLRRTKDLVCYLPEMSEVILYHGLSSMQKNLYVAILMKNLGLVEKSLINKQKLLNTLMQLRKCVGHPYLFDGRGFVSASYKYFLHFSRVLGIEPEPFEEGDHLIFNSGKLMVLDALLSYLSKTGHKVLIFSQMVRILDIVQDYMTFKNYTYERLDGSVRGEERFASIKRFNKNQETFAFLLSTRAGGLGLTLTSADTVVFLDSDFNPQNDIQASARAHRIGQSK